MNHVRLGQLISHECEWQLRDLAAYMGSLLALGRADDERNPLRAEIIGAALNRGIEAISGDREHRRMLARELGQAVAQAMPECYAQIVEMLQERGIQPVHLTVRTVEGPGNQMFGAANSGYATLPRDGRNSTRSGHGELDEPPARATSTCWPRIGVPWPRRSRPAPPDSIRDPMPAPRGPRAAADEAARRRPAADGLAAPAHGGVAGRRARPGGPARPARGRRLAAARRRRRRWIRRRSAAAVAATLGGGGCRGAAAAATRWRRSARRHRRRAWRRPGGYAGTATAAACPRASIPAAAAGRRSARKPRATRRSPAATASAAAAASGGGGGRLGHPVQRRPDRPDGRQPDPRPPRGADPGLDRQARPHGDRRRRQPVRPDPVRLARAAADGAPDRPPAAAGAARRAQRLDLLLDRGATRCAASSTASPRSPAPSTTSTTAPARSSWRACASWSHEIVEGDFDQIELYAAKLAELESFIAEQTEGEVEQKSGAVTHARRQGVRAARAAALHAAAAVGARRRCRCRPTCTTSCRRSGARRWCSRCAATAPTPTARSATGASAATW